MSREQTDSLIPPDPRRREREIDPHRTRVSSTLVVIGSAAAAIAAAGFFAGARMNELTTKIGRLEERQADVLTKKDLDELRSDMPGLAVQTLNLIKVSCPSFVIRGAQTVVCDPIIPPSLIRFMPRGR